MLKKSSAVLLFLLFTNAHAVQTHTKFWTSGTQTGALSKDKKVRYYLEEDLRFEDDKYKFEQVLLWLGIGYRIKPTVTFYIGDAPDVSRNLSGAYVHQNIVWQQLSWFAYRGTTFQFSSRSRLEEIKRSGESQWQILLRQQLLFKIPFQNWKDHALILSDSIFFNLEHPAWVQNNSFISQNRASFGIETTVTDQFSYTIGYMNQYIFRHPNQMANIALISFNLHTD